jgi:hypothetical protein
MQVKGMVQVDGVTYRIDRVASARYDVIRVLVEVSESKIDPSSLREIGRTAIQRAKTSWVGRLVLA